MALSSHVTKVQKFQKKKLWKIYQNCLICTIFASFATFTFCAVNSCSNKISIECGGFFNIRLELVCQWTYTFIIKQHSTTAQLITSNVKLISWRINFCLWIASEKLKAYYKHLTYASTYISIIEIKEIFYPLRQRLR